LEAGDHLRRCIPSYARYYRSKYSETCFRDESVKHKHKRAQVLTGSKALALIVSLLRHQKPYRAKEGDAPLACAIGWLVGQAGCRPRLTSSFAIVSASARFFKKSKTAGRVQRGHS